MKSAARGRISNQGMPFLTTVIVSPVLLAYAANLLRCVFACLLYTPLSHADDGVLRGAGEAVAFHAAGAL